jgi:uncharacterized protein (DUF302 family)
MTNYIRIGLVLCLFALPAEAEQKAINMFPGINPPQGQQKPNPFLIPNTALPNPLVYLGLMNWVNVVKSPPQSKPYQFAPVLDPKMKTLLMQGMVTLLGQFGIRDVMNFMTIKYKARSDLSFDDVVESMKLRANQLNFKLVGHSPMWKDFQAVLGDMHAPRMEVFHYCDIAAGREVLKLSPEAIAYLPCRIAVMQDSDGNIWVITLDWNMAWLDQLEGGMGVHSELSKYAIDIRDKMDNIMRAAANGDL